jgi:hypothetical protein
MCSGCGRCGKVETGDHSVVTFVAPSVELIQVASSGSAPDAAHPCEGTTGSRSGEPSRSLNAPMI